jgi:hypothetical protein
MCGLVLTIPDRVLSALEEGDEPSLAVRQRQRQQIATVEVQRVEAEIDKVGTSATFCDILD